MTKTTPMPVPTAPAETRDALEAGLRQLQRVPVAQRLVSWQAVHGRHDLPWQGTRDPYRVWLSELMLQQTQVATVLGYYERFLTRFPHVQALAAALQDEVLALWSGLGYYARARNMHACAQAVVSQHGGVFPTSAQALAALPGIGPSTAAAIAAFCFEERVAIFDGNVKRVLARVLGFDEDLASTAAAKRLQQLAQAALPQEAAHMPAYTQAIMDLGATVCTPRRPRCDACPLRVDCVAHGQGRQEQLPCLTRKLKRTAQAWQLLVAQAPDGRVWLTQRPSRGIWASLYAWPMRPGGQPLSACEPAGLQVDERQASRAVKGGPAGDACPAEGAQPHAEAGVTVEVGSTFKHVLTHMDLYLTPVWLRFANQGCAEHWARSQAEDGQWLLPEQARALGLPKPVRDMLEDLLEPRLL